MSSSSRSDAQVKAEQVMRGLASEQLGAALSPQRVPLPSGATVHVDGASTDPPRLIEIYARVSDKMATSQQNKMVADAAKIALVRDTVPDYRGAECYVVVNADSWHFPERSWRYQLLEHLGVNLLPVAVDTETARLVEEAQLAQLMVNPPDAAD